VIRDDFAGLMQEKWSALSAAPADSREQLVASVLSDTRLWGTDLSYLDGFTKKVASHLRGLIENGFKNSGI
jgi:mannitol-1-phosphate/altronate dehydrogenase